MKRGVKMDLQDYYHNIGKLPDKFYYQLKNDKAQESYNKHIEQIQEKIYQDKIKTEIEDFVKITLDDILAELVF